MRALLLLPCLIAGASASASEPALAEELFGPADVLTTTGNGGLTVSANRYGRVSVCKWPSPSYHDQLTYQTETRGDADLGVEPSDGLMWGIRLQDRTLWLAGPPWECNSGYFGEGSPVAATTARLADISVAADQLMFVHPRRDVLALRLVIRGLPDAPRIFWYANFTPCTRLIPEMPVADWALDGLNDFAAFSDSGPRRVYHFRPGSVDEAQWRRAERLVAGNAKTAEWSSFSDGTWIGYTSPNRSAGFQCGNVDASSSAYAQASAGALAGASSAVGPCNSAIELAPIERAGAFVATVFVGFGDNRDEVDASLSYAIEQGYARLLDSTARAWQSWLAQAELPDTQDPAIRSACRKSLLTLALLRNRATGAVARRPVTQPPGGLDWTRNGVWINLALDTAGFRDFAEDHIFFALQTVRTSPAPGKPLGSMPAACYANRVEAVPHAILDVEAVCWFIWSVWRHASFLSSPARRLDFLEKTWGNLRLCTDFVAGWRHAQTGRTLHSFDPTRLKDAQYPRLDVMSYVGLNAALQMARELKKEEPEPWLRRTAELEALILFQYVYDAGNWPVDDALPLWLSGLARPRDPRWADVVRKLLAGLEDKHGPEAGWDLLQLAVLAQDRAETMERLKKTLADGVGRALNLKPSGLPGSLEPVTEPDSLSAALVYLAASVAYGAPLD